MKSTAPFGAADPASGTEPPRRGGVTIVGTLALLVAALGGLNWGLVGIAGVDVVATVLGDGTAPTRAVQAAFGAAALYCLFMLPRWSRAG